MSCRKPEAIDSSGRSTSREKKQDEDLLLFREMLKREKERNLCLLQPESVELEPGQGTYLLHKIPSWKKDLLVTESSKNDYDWLKTPPATPLFPSLEMEANQPNMVLHREIPPLHPFKPSRFKGKPEEESKPVTPKSSSPKSASSSQPVTPKGIEGPLIPMAKRKQAISSTNRQSNFHVADAKPLKEPTKKTTTLARSRTPPPVNPATNPTTLARSRTPPPLNPGKVSVITGVAKSEQGKPRRESDSPRDGKQQNVAMKGRSNAVKQPVVGEKVMKDSKTKDVNGVWKLNVGFGKFKSRDSYDNAHKCTGVRNTPTQMNHPNGGHANNSQPSCTFPGTDSSHQTPHKDAKNPRGQLAKHITKAGTFFRRAKTE